MTDDHAATLKRFVEYRRVLEEVLVARINYTLVAHSMLLVAFATIFSGTSHAHWSSWAEIVLIFSGIGLAYVQNFLARSVTGKTRYLDNQIELLDPDYKKFMALGPQGADEMQWLWIPCGLFAIWACLFVAVLGDGCSN
jgi:hypothetical protein